MTNLSRRSFLAGLFVAPAIIKTPGLIMPIKPLPLVITDYIEPSLLWRADGNQVYVDIQAMMEVLKAQTRQLLAEHLSLNPRWPLPQLPVK